MNTLKLLITVVVISLLITGCSLEETITEEITADYDVPSTTNTDVVTTTDGCTNTCYYSYDGECDDGGLYSSSSYCELGTDCVDCGTRDLTTSVDTTDTTTSTDTTPSTDIDDYSCIWISNYNYTSDTMCKWDKGDICDQYYGYKADCDLYQ